MTWPLPWPSLLDDAHQDLYLRTRREGRETFQPLEQHGGVNRPLLNALAEHRLLGMLYPAEFGGLQDEAVSAVDLCLIREALGAECTEAETAFAMQGLGGYPILEAGSRELVERWIPEIVVGRAVAAFALTEPAAGSDAGAIAMEAIADGDGYRLTGEKIWISNAPEADIYTVFARTAGETGSNGITAFAVPGSSEGLSGQAQHLVSPHAIGKLVFDGVFVPGEAVLGEVDHGLRVAFATLNRFRPSVGAFGVGIAQRALELSQLYVDERHAFGGPLRGLQSVSHKLARMAVNVHTARQVVYDAATAFDSDLGRLIFRSSSAKYVATELAQQVVDDAIQLHGAVALEVGHPLEHLYREVRTPRIYEGASDVQLEIIARDLAQEARVAGQPWSAESGSS